MTTYSIYFENQSESTQNYALFSEVPKISSNVGSPIAYSNVFHSWSVANDGNWSIEITKTYYACWSISVYWVWLMADLFAQGAALLLRSFRQASKFLPVMES